MSCRVSGTPLIELLDFGSHPLGNGFLAQSEFSEEYFYSMKVGFSETSMMFQLIDQPAPEKMFHDHYAFYSSTSKFMEAHFKDFAESVITSPFIDHNSFVVELGCNDGIMLKNFAHQGIHHLGIEPSVNVAAEANKLGVNTITEFFTEEVAQKIVQKEGKADVFIAANVMCHIPDICGVVKAIRTLLKPSGVAIFEDPYLGDVVKKTSYDQIYDEHVFLFSALSVQHLFSLYGMELIDVIPQKTHGGSMRYVLANKNTYPVKPSVQQLIATEKVLGLDKLESLMNFASNVHKSRTDLLNLISSLTKQGKRVAGYGATSKSTTVLNFCGIGPDLVEFISDTTPIKQNKYSPGMHIPVLSYESFKMNPPDYAILFAWNHAEEIMAKEHDYIAAGGKWIVHVPEVKVL